MTGPIFQLHILGSICPCFLSSERRNVFQAIQFLNHNCRRIQWHPPAAAPKSSGLFSPSSWFQRSSNDDGDDDNDEGETETGPYLAILVLRDSPNNGKPVLCIQPATSSTRSAKQRPIPLRRVDTVSLDNDAIVGYSKKQAGVAAKELLRFVPLHYSPDDDDIEHAATSNTMVPVASDIRNMLLHHCMVLIEWERQRTLQSQADGEDDSDDEDERQPNFLQAQAQKAKHFATRELELQRTQKEREKRKAQLVAQTGGLKYTAIAMANQQR